MTRFSPITNMDLDPRPHRFGWAPGSYICKCGTCEEQFIGDKRAMTCADCAYKQPDLAPSVPQPAVTEIDLLRAALKKIAEQKLPLELDGDDLDCADFEGGYAAVIKIAREAIR